MEEARASSSGQKSPIKSTLGITGRSNATPSTRISQKVARGSDPYLGGGKLGKSKRGWHSLPPNVVHRILDLALPQIHLPPAVAESWRRAPESHEVALTARKRIWLCELRYVCLGWKKAVDSYSFWPSYTLILDPSKSHHSSVSDLQTSRTTPSTPSYPTLFHRALRTTNQVCLPCRLNHPDRLGLYPAKRQNSRYTPHFHRVTSCERHASFYCTHCLRGRQTLALIDGHYQAGDSLLKFRIFDYDTESQRIPSISNCFSCRQFALEYHVEQALVKAARGGPVPQVDIVKWIDGSEVAQEYILDWGETSKRTASVMIDDTWLHHHTRYSEFLELADGCMAHDTRLVDRFTRSGDMETPEQFIARSDRIASFLCVSPDDMGDFIRRLRRHTIDMYRDAKRISAIKEEEEDEEEDGEEYADEEPEPYNREAFWTTECVDAAVYNFVRDRIRSGYWVHPSDELASYLGHEDLDPVDHHTLSSKLPPGVQHRPDRSYYHQSTFKSSTLQLHPRAAIDYYPSQEQLEELDSTFNDLLVRYLTGPIAYYRFEHETKFGWGIEDFDAKFPEAGYESTKGLLDYISSKGECWYPFLDDSEGPNGQNHGHGDHRPIHVTASVNGHDRYGRDTRKSPVIEVVEDTETSSIENNPWDVQSEDTNGHLSTCEDESESGEDEIGPTGISRSNTNSNSEERAMNHHLIETGLPSHPDPKADHLITRATAVQNSSQGIYLQGDRETDAMKDDRPASNLGNGKRKTPPPVSDTSDEPATKRRSPSGPDTIQSVTNGDDIGDDGTSTPISSVLSSTSSEVDSSPSDPTDPMPVTPEDPILSAQAQQHHSTRTLPPGQEQILKHDQGDEIETRTLTSVVQERPKIAYNDLPHIPSSRNRLGPKTDQLIYELVLDRIRPMRDCGCKICTRGRNLREMVAAQAELLGRVFEDGGDAGVRFALGLS